VLRSLGICLLGIAIGGFWCTICSASRARCEHYHGSLRRSWYADDRPLRARAVACAAASCDGICCALITVARRCWRRRSRYCLPRSAASDAQAVQDSAFYFGNIRRALGFFVGFVLMNVWPAPALDISGPAGTGLGFARWH
jgi:hypothetical protein